MRCGGILWGGRLLHLDDWEHLAREHLALMGLATCQWTGCTGHGSSVSDPANTSRQSVSIQDHGCAKAAAPHCPVSARGQQHGLFMGKHGRTAHGITAASGTIKFGAFNLHFSLVF